MLCALKKVCIAHMNRTSIHVVTTPSCLCTGCGRCRTIDGELEAYISSFPVSNSIPGMPRVNFPNVCTKQPLGRSAFCREHHAIAQPGWQWGCFQTGQSGTSGCEAAAATARTAKIFLGPSASKGKKRSPGISHTRRGWSHRVDEQDRVTSRLDRTVGIPEPEAHYSRK